MTQHRPNVHRRGMLNSSVASLPAKVMIANSPPVIAARVVRKAADGLRSHPFSPWDHWKARIGWVFFISSGEPQVIAPALIFHGEIPGIWIIMDTHSTLKASLAGCSLSLLSLPGCSDRNEVTSKTWPSTTTSAEAPREIHGDHGFPWMKPIPSWPSIVCQAVIPLGKSYWLWDTAMSKWSMKNPLPHDFRWFWLVNRYPATYGLQIHNPQQPPTGPNRSLPVGQSTQQSLLVLCFATSAKVYADITKPARRWGPELSWQSLG